MSSRPSASPRRPLDDDLEGGEEVPPGVPVLLLLEVPVAAVPEVALGRDTLQPANQSPEPSVADIAVGETDIELGVAAVDLQERDHLVHRVHLAVIEGDGPSHREHPIQVPEVQQHEVDSVVTVDVGQVHSRIRREQLGKGEVTWAVDVLVPVGETGATYGDESAVLVIFVLEWVDRNETTLVPDLLERRQDCELGDAVGEAGLDDQGGPPRQDGA